MVDGGAELTALKRLMERKERRIAVYGGTFDPVHNGHLAIARELQSLFWLDEFLFMPAYVAPHKREAHVTRALHRYAMLALATQDDARSRISTLELDAPERPFTIETIERLLIEESTAGNTRLFFVMGADSWAEIMTWREWERLLMMTNHIVVTRPHNKLDAAHVTPQIRARIVDLRGMAADERDRMDVARILAEGSPGARIFFTDAVLMDVSATAIRHAVRTNQRETIASSLPASVADYIEKYALYKDADERQQQHDVTDGERKSAH